jgi:hypothetical protein
LASVTIVAVHLLPPAGVLDIQGGIGRAVAALGLNLQHSLRLRLDESMALSWESHWRARKWEGGADGGTFSRRRPVPSEREQHRHWAHHTRWTSLSSHRSAVRQLGLVLPVHCSPSQLVGMEKETAKTVWNPVVPCGHPTGSTQIKPSEASVSSSAAYKQHVWSPETHPVGVALRMTTRSSDRGAPASMTRGGPHHPPTQGPERGAGPGCPSAEGPHRKLPDLGWKTKDPANESRADGERKGLQNGHRRRRGGGGRVGLSLWPVGLGWGWASGGQLPLPSPRVRGFFFFFWQF